MVSMSYLTKPQHIRPHVFPCSLLKNCEIAKKGSSVGTGVGPLHTKPLWIKCPHLPVLNQVQTNIIGTV